MEDGQVQQEEKIKMQQLACLKMQKRLLPAETWPGLNNRTLSFIQVVMAHMLRNSCFSTYLELQK